MSSTQTRKRRSDGERSRAAILEEAAKLSTVEGLGGLSLARLADAVGMSKSGLFAHFGSKEELQLATVERAAGDLRGARGRAGDARARRARAAPRVRRALPPLRRAGRLPRRLLLRGRADGDEHAARPCARPASSRSSTPGSAPSRTTVREGQAKGELDPTEDPDQLAFELEAAFFLANNQFVVKHSSEPLERARRTIEQRLAAITLPSRNSRRPSAVYRSTGKRASSRRFPWRNLTMKLRLLLLPVVAVLAALATGEVRTGRAPRSRLLNPGAARVSMRARHPRRSFAGSRPSTRSPALRTSRRSSRSA